MKMPHFHLKLLLLHVIREEFGHWDGRSDGCISRVPRPVIECDGAHHGLHAAAEGTNQTVPTKPIAPVTEKLQRGSERERRTEETKK